MPLGGDAEEVITEQPGTLNAFRHRDFTIFWIGAFISNTGSWLQNLTVPFVVFSITHSALWVGLATVAQFVPGFFASPVGGHLADSRDRRSLLIVLQIFMGLTALALWLLWFSGSRSIGWILSLVALGGLIWGMTLPSWQAFVNDLVPREDLVSAVSLNSLQFNAARSLGPAVAGFVIAAFGPGWAFGLNAASFGVVVLALIVLRTRTKVADSATDRPSLRRGFVDAIRYLPTQPGIVMIIVLVALVGLVSTPVFAFTVVFAGSVYHVSALRLGLLNTAVGVGAVLAVPLVVRAKSHGGMGRSVRSGMLILGLAELGFAALPGFYFGMAALVAVGLGFLITISSGNTALQLMVAQRLRGRVMAIRLMAYMVSTPIGALIQGRISDSIGPRPTLVGAGAVMLVLVALLYLPAGTRAIARIDDPQDLADYQA